MGPSKTEQSVSSDKQSITKSKGPIRADLKWSTSLITSDGPIRGMPQVNIVCVITNTGRTNLVHTQIPFIISYKDPTGKVLETTSGKCG